MCEVGGRGVAFEVKGSAMDMMGSRLDLWVDDRAVGLGPTIAEELPGVANLADEVEVEVGDNHIIAVAPADGEHLAPGIAEVSSGRKTRRSARDLQSQAG